MESANGIIFARPPSTIHIAILQILEAFDRKGRKCLYRNGVLYLMKIENMSNNFQAAIMEPSSILSRSERNTLGRIEDNENVPLRRQWTLV